MNLIAISTTCGILIGTLGFIVCIFWYGEKVSRKNRELLETQKKMEKNRNLYFNEYLGEIEVLISSIRTSLEQGVGLEDVLLQCRRDEPLVNTGIASVDSLLTYKKAICIDRGIKLTIEMTSLPREILPEAEYISLLGNLMDNGMEAAEKTKIPWVEIKGKTMGTQWILRVRNGKKPDCLPIENQMTTTKTDGENHGFGMKIINKIVKEHQGIIEKTDLGDSFEVFIIFDKR